ncbi:MAG: formate dehydrogenase accessory sulfurtransferase FdhD [Burkholderiaceae bacterium]|jgi:FdhD protein|nr:formate dehydrogenase accessory sulfurtransferase FdhD [Burkholderiaceae bacterium]
MNESLVSKPIASHELPPATRLMQAHQRMASSGPIQAVPRATQRLIAAEIPVSFYLEGAPYAVMMASPNDAEDFAYGFCLTEGIVVDAREIISVEVHALASGISVEIELSHDPLRKRRLRRRAIAGRTGCGICGIGSIDQLHRAPWRASGAALPVPARSVFAALGRLGPSQRLNAMTGAFHAAAFCSRDGAVRFVREDVGRHNALDKLIGALMRAAVSPDDGFIVVTSRASFELVEKAAIIGARTLVAISAPTSLAIERAHALGLTLAAIARADSLLVFCGALGADDDPGVPPGPQDSSAIQV